MLIDDDLIENGDMYIFDRMKEFLQEEVVGTFAASGRVLVWIDRVVSHTRLLEGSGC